ncbi:MAG: glycosyltransferase family 4 protein [Chloroflexota bacterium]|nr:glycosyltransferase family 4 protein [Chloroflexota bacterium]
MRIVYVLPSPTFGMHQYTADLANRMAAAGHDVSLVTTSTLPRDRYSPAVTIEAPITTHNTGFSSEGLHIEPYRVLERTIRDLVPDVVHITGVHLWNVLLVRRLRTQGLPVIHSLHDLDPHFGVRFGRLIRLWNRLIVANASHVLVHGQIYKERLLAGGMAPDRVSYTPLLHLFLSYDEFAELVDGEVNYEQWALFFGRFEPYKGVAQLLDAVTKEPSFQSHTPRLVLAGNGALPTRCLEENPPGIEVRNRQIEDREAIDLFSRCGLLVLPYLDASQSALIGAAYYFRKPVIVTRTGALAEYVIDGETGWIVSPGDVTALGNRLSEALSDPTEMKRMGMAGRAWYDRQRILEFGILLDMYQSVVASA